MWRAHEIGQDEFRDFLGKRESVIIASVWDAGADDQVDTREPLSTFSRTGLQHWVMTGSTSLNIISSRSRSLSPTPWFQAVSSNCINVTKGYMLIDMYSQFCTYPSRHSISFQLPRHRHGSSGYARMSARSRSAKVLHRQFPYSTFIV